MSITDCAQIGVGRHALVVDDELTVGHVIGSVLEQMGYTVSFAGNGEEALQAVEATNFDVIVCDILMPRVNGMVLFDMWAASRPEAIERTVFVTGDNLGSETRDFVARTGRPCIFKPFRLDDLADIVAQVQHAGQ